VLDSVAIERAKNPEQATTLVADLIARSGLWAGARYEIVYDNNSRRIFIYSEGGRPHTFDNAGTRIVELAKGSGKSLREGFTARRWNRLIAKFEKIFYGQK